MPRGAGIEVLRFEHLVETFLDTKSYQRRQRVHTLCLSFYKFIVRKGLFAKFPALFAGSRILFAGSRILFAGFPVLLVMFTFTALKQRARV
ncbi:Uncharacterised protein [Cytobacillus firmus]|nr:Uncharacterised protein [Cytobacillus firmus]